MKNWNLALFKSFWLSLSWKLSEIEENPFWHLGASYLEASAMTIPKIIAKLYSKPRTFVLQFQIDQSTKVIARKPLCLKMDDNDDRQIHKIIWPQNFCSRIKKIVWKLTKTKNTMKMNNYKSTLSQILNNRSTFKYSEYLSLYCTYYEQQ